MIPTLSADEQAELEVLCGNLAAGTCVGERASWEQEVIRAERIFEIVIPWSRYTGLPAR